MGYIVFDAAIAVVGDYTADRLNLTARVEEWRASLPAEWQPLVIGPVISVTNGYYTWFFAPDGSKSGWSTDAEGETYRAAFGALFADAYADVVEVGFGGDSRGDPVISHLPGATDD